MRVKLKEDKILIITAEILEQNIDKKIKYFNDKTYIISIINTEGSLGVVCYLINGVWQPFCYDYGAKKFKTKAKNYRGLINDIPELNRDNIADIKGKFYNTFDTTIEVNNEVFNTTFEVVNTGKDNLLERKTYYLITDIQELERTFNSSIIPCEIINVNDIESKKVDESLISLIKKLN